MPTSLERLIKCGRVRRMIHDRRVGRNKYTPAEEDKKHRDGKAKELQEGIRRLPRDSDPEEASS